LLALPFATFGDPAVEKYVVMREQLQPEYYMAIVAVYNPASLQRKFSDIMQAQYLLVPGTILNSSSSNPCHDYVTSLRTWFFYPVHLPCRNVPLEPTSAVRSFITEHYSPVEHIDSWVVLRRDDPE
jgi:hypothetical protein